MSTLRTDNTGSTDNSRRGGSHAWMVMTGVLALAVIGLLAYLLLGRHDDRTPQAVSSSPGPAHTVPSSAAPAAPVSSAPAPSPSVTDDQGSWHDRGCNGTRGSSGNPAPALAKATWKPFLTVSIPSSPELGPTDTATVVRRCYQHSPAGAVMAAVNLTYGQYAPNGQRVLEEQWTPGPGQRKAVNDLSSWSGTVGSVVAYRLDGCEAQHCNVDLVVFGSGIYGEGSVPLVWAGDDWKVDGSHETPEPGVVQGVPAGFTAWGAAS